MKCGICGSEAEKIFEGTVLGRHRAEYYACRGCGFLFIPEPSWLKEAYKSPINVTDTGILQRNISLAEKAAVIISLFFDRKSRFLDFAGGYGIFTRLMRDIGFDFLWHDPYASNLFARGFERSGDAPVEMLTTFESFEHFTDPAAELEKMLLISRNILFTTTLLPDPVPRPAEWWYYGLEHGQHISFYTEEALRALGRKFSLNLYTNGRDLHLFTPERISPALFRLAAGLGSRWTRKLLCSGLAPRTVEDMERLSMERRTE